MQNLVRQAEQAARVQDGPWKNLNDVERATLTWGDWLNNRRLLEPIGDIPPTEYEMMYYQNESANAA